MSTQKKSSSSPETHICQGVVSPLAYLYLEYDMIKATFLGLMHGVSEMKVEGALADGREVSGILCEGEEPGDFFWEPSGGDNPGLVPFNPNGVVPGDSSTGWDEILEALSLI